MSSIRQASLRAVYGSGRSALHAPSHLQASTVPIFLQPTSSSVVRPSSHQGCFHTSTARAAQGTGGKKNSQTSANKAHWPGRQPHEHVTDQDHHINVHSSASKAGREERAQGGQASATSEQDKGKQNQKAKEDHPEAPQPVIGMNDERGQTGHRK